MKTILIALTILLPTLITAQKISPAPSQKALRYHEILKKNPESSPVLKRFQATWLTEKDEASLTEFLTEKSKNGTAADHKILAYHHLVAGRDTQALTALNLALTENPNHPLSLLTRAQIQTKLFHLEQALADTNLAIKHTIDPETLLKANKQKGSLLLRAGKTEQAIAHWQTLAKTHANDQDLIEDVIDIQLNDGLLEPALELATSLRNNTKDPYKKAMRSLSIAEIQAKSSQPAQAIQTLLDTLQSSGSNSWLEREIIARLETIHKNQNNLSGLIETLQSIADQNPQRTLVLQKLADLRADQGDIKNAKEIYNDLLAKNPGNTDLKSAYIQILRKGEQHKLALEILESLIKNKPTDPQLILTKIEILHQTENRPDLLAAIQHYQKIAKPTPATALKHAALLDQYKFPDQALAAYQKIPTTHPESLEAAFTTAEYLHQKKHPEQATKLWKTIAKTADPISLTRLLETLLAHDQKQLALEIVTQKHPSLKTNTTFLRSAALTASANEKFPQALAYARDLLSLSDQASTLRPALSLTLNLINRAKQQQQILQELTDKQNLSTPETCLLIELHEQNNNTPAADLLLKSLATHAEPLALLQAAHIYQSRYQLDKAAAALEKLATLPQRGTLSHLKKLVEVYHQANLTNKALETIQRWKTLAPQDKTAWLTEIDLIEKTQGAASAIPILRRCIQRFDSPDDLLLRLASLHTAANQHNRAIEILTQLHDRSQSLDDKLRLVTALAIAAKSNATTPDLIKKFETQLRKNPQDIAPILALAEIYHLLNQRDQEREYLQQASRLRPTDTNILFKIANNQQKSNKNDQALKTLQQAAAIDKTPAASQRLANLYMEMGNIELGLAEIAKNNLQNPRRLESTTLTLLAQHEYEHAKILLEKSRPAHPEDWRLTYLTALTDYHLGLLTESLKTSLTLLNVENEIQNLTSGWNTVSFSQRYIPDYNTLPSQVRSLLTALQSRSQHNDYLNQHKSLENHGSHIPYTVSSFARTLPLEPSGVQSLARIHILTILEEASQKDRKNLNALVENAGFHGIPALTALINPSGDNTSGLKELEAVLLENPTNENLLLYLTKTVSGFSLKLSPQILQLTKNYYEKHEHPAIFKNLLPYYQTPDTDDDEHRRIQLQAIAEKPTITHQDFQAAVYLGIARTDAPKGPARKIIETYLAQNPITNPDVSYYTATPQEKNLITAQSTLFRLILSSEDIPAIISTIEDDKVFDYYQTYSRNYSSYHYASRQPLSFPPAALSEVPQGILNLFKPDNTNFTPESLKPNLHLFKKPLTRALAQHYCGETKQALATIQKTLTSHPELAADTLIIKASIILSQKEHDPVAVLKTLIAAHKVSKDQYQKSYLDQMLLVAASKIKKPLELEQTDLAAVQATLRRSAKKIPSYGSQQSQLITSLLQNYGLEKQIPHLIPSNVHSSNRSSSPSKSQGSIIGKALPPRYQSHSNRTNPKSPFELAKDAILDDKKPLAAKQFTLALKQLGSSNSYQINRICKEIINANLQNEVLALGHPNNSIDPRKWLQYHALARNLSVDKATKEAIAKIKSIKHIPPSIAPYIAFELSTSDPEFASQILSTTKDIPAVGRAYNTFINQLSKHPDQYLTLNKIIAKYITSIDPSDYKNSLNLTTTLHSILNTLANSSPSGIPSYTQPQPKAQKEHQDFIQKRDALLTPLFTHILNTYHNNVTAFNILTRRKIALKEPLDTLIPLAQATLSIPDINQDTTNANTTSTHFPLTFLLQQAVKTKNLDLITPEIVKTVDNSKSTTHPNLARIKTILSLSKSKRQAELTADITDDKTALDELVLRHTILELTNDIHNIPVAKKSLDYLTNPEIALTITNRSDIKHLTTIFTHHTAVLSTENPKALQPLLDKLIESTPSTFSDNPTAWLLELQNTSYSGQFSTPQAAILLLIRTACLSPNTHETIIAFTTKHQIPLAHFFILQNYNYSLDAKFKPDPTRYLSLLRKANLLTSLKNLKFKKLPAIQNIDESSLSSSTSQSNIQLPLYQIELITRNLAVHWRSRHNEIKAFAKALKEDESFGAALIYKAAFDQGNAFNFLKEHLKSVLAASPEQQQAIGHILQIQSQFNTQSQIDSIHPNLFNILTGEKSDSNKKLAERINKYLTDAPRTTSQSGHQHISIVTNLLKDLQNSDPDTSAKLVLHILDTIVKNPHFYSQHTSTSNSVNLSSYIYKNVTSEINIEAQITLLLHISKSEYAHRIDLATILRSKGDRKIRGKDAIPTLTEIAKSIEKIKDPAAKEFITTAWTIAFSETNPAEPHTLAIILEKASNKNPELRNTLTRFSTVLQLADQARYGRPSDQLTPQYQKFRQKELNLQNQFLALTDDLSLQNQLNLLTCYALESFLSSKTRSETHSPTTESLKKISNILERASQNPSLASAPQIAYILKLIENNQQNLTPELINTLAKSSLKILEANLHTITKDKENVHIGAIEIPAILAAQSPDLDQALNQLINKNIPTLKGLSTIAIEMILNGHYDTASKILAPTLTHYQPIRPNITYTATLHTAFKKFIKTIKNPIRKLRISNLILSIPDTQDFNLVAPLNKSQRLHLLAKQFQTTKPLPSSPLGQQILTELTEPKDHTIIPYLGHLVTQPTGTPFLTNTHFRSSGIEYNLLNLGIQQLLLTDPKTYTKQLNEIITKYHAKQENRYVAGQLIRAYTFSLIKLTTDLYYLGEKEKLKSLLPTLRRAVLIENYNTKLPDLNLKAELSHGSINSQIYPLTEFIHTILGQQEKYQKLIQDLPEAQQKRIQITQPQSPPFLLYNFTRYRGKLDNDLTKQQFEKILNEPYFQKHYLLNINPDCIFNPFIKFNQLSPKQAANLYDNLNIEINIPDFALKIHADKATVYAKADRKDKATEHLEKLTELLKSKNPLAAAPYQIHAATLYHHIGETKLAKQTLPKSIPKNLDQYSKQKFNTLQKSFNKK